MFSLLLSHFWGRQAHWEALENSNLSVKPVDKGLYLEQPFDEREVRDLERLLLENGSAGEDLWGFNLYPEEEGEDFIEYDYLINIRSWQNNPTRDMLDPDVLEAIKQIVEQFIIG